MGVLSLKENVNIFIGASPECGPQTYPQCIGLWTLLKTRRKGIDTISAVISGLLLLPIFLLEFDSMQRWLAAYDLDLMPEPLAQHYGLDTPMLDFTDDFDIALFFATCCYDASRRQWRPLNESDFSRDLQSKYGVIFHIPRWNAGYISTFSRHWDPDFDRSTFTIDHIVFQVFL